SIGLAAPHFTAFSEGRKVAYQVFKAIDAEPAIHSDADGRMILRLRGEVEFRRVKFAFPHILSQPLFSGLSLLLPAGKTVALVGPSGSGKSTLLALLLRFYDPQDGMVLIDHHNIRRLQLKWLRRQIGIVGDDPAIFSATIRENIMYGKEGANLQEVEMAARLANANDFIVSLPDKYETQVGDCGQPLTAGQRQRIAIARTLIRNPSILLLDEPTLGVDPVSERMVLKAVDNSIAGRTAIVVTNRLWTIRNADLIVVLHDGQLVEAGQHDELMSRGPVGFYARMVMEQEQTSSQGRRKHRGGGDSSRSLSSRLRGPSRNDTTDSRGPGSEKLKQGPDVGHQRQSSDFFSLVRTFAFSISGLSDHSLDYTCSVDFSIGEEKKRLIRRPPTDMNGWIQSLAYAVSGLNAKSDSKESCKSSATQEPKVEKMLGKVDDKGRVEKPMVSHMFNDLRDDFCCPGPWPYIKWLLFVRTPDKGFGFLGVVGATASGAVFPLWGLLLSRIVEAYFADYHAVTTETRVCSLGLIGLGIGCLIAYSLQHWSLAIIGERLIKSIRETLFMSILKQKSP
ncbi:hypothetical protein CBR_g54356, partial [Chara braunii]